MQDTSYAIEVMELGPMENFIYLITDKKTRRTAVVDPAWDVPSILAWARDKDIAITDILLTHSHHDHINGIEGVLAEHDAQLHLCRAEAEFWGKYLDLPTLHRGGDIIRLGETEIAVMHTPGHTPGSACYHLGNDVISGDTMFVYGCGRCDLSGGDPEQMFDTLRRMSNELATETRILPGHNYSVTPTCTMGQEIEGNPFMHFSKKADFIEYRMHIHDRIRHEPYGPVHKNPT
ncbi:MAG: MBL fold metallo-hydrolase [Gammaproteobacteria bacterium]|nr:MBL fold metallo-hydrolase [Gammaproteobacteria bacterium]